eukprot:scaffold3728_cov72-Skeletonema_dohrnii-CCMP3373.AAC.1
MKARILGPMHQTLHADSNSSEGSRHNEPPVIIFHLLDEARGRIYVEYSQDSILCPYEAVFEIGTRFAGSHTQMYSARTVWAPAPFQKELLHDRSHIILTSETD